MRKLQSFVWMAIILTACSGNGTGKAPAKDTAIRITTGTVKNLPGESSLHYSGTIEPLQTIPLTFQTTGTVEKVMVEEGDNVRKGQVLATVKAGNDQNMYNAALAKYQQAKDAYERLREVHEKGSLPEVRWVEMETNMKQAESQLEITRNNLDNCILRAPEEGMIGRRNIEPGQSAIGITAPIELVKIDKVVVKISVPENEISRIKKDQKATFTIAALGDKTFTGKVTGVGIMADRISRTYEVKVTVDNPGHLIKPGMVCDVYLNAGNEKTAVIVPYNAVGKDADGNAFVFVVSPDRKTVRKQPVTVGNYQTAGIEVSGGLLSGQTVVVEGKDKLSDNSLITL
ncbi:MAG: efflux RND transporter periplasmic adaptor subunit [Syntrophothermus sp.]